MDVVREAIDQHRASLQHDGDRPEHPQLPPVPHPSQAGRFVRTESPEHEEDHTDSASHQQDDEPPSPLNTRSNLVRRHTRTQSDRRSSISGYRLPPPDTPSGRTGPPRSISRSYSLSVSSGRIDSRTHSKQASEPSAQAPETHHGVLDNSTDFPQTTPFRGVLEFDNPSQRERERQRAEKIAKRRDSNYFESRNPLRRLIETPREEASQFRLQVSPGPREDHDGAHENGEASEQTPEDPQSPQSSTVERIRPRHSHSMPHISRSSEGTGRPSAAPKWNRLRSLLPQLAGQSRTNAQHASAVVPQSVNITDELIAGGLSALVLRLWFERDEKGHRRVPILFHRLRIRVSDSLHPLHGHKAVFRIECEYANGAVRWVVYRQLREFLSLHTHYAFSNAYLRNVETLPEFPRTSMCNFCSVSAPDSDGLKVYRISSS